jgi:hypothetical protein
MAKRYVKQVRTWLANAEKREAEGLTARQRAILKMLDDLPPVEPTTD